MDNPESHNDLSDVRALLAAYAALSPRERRALLELAQAMVPERQDLWTGGGGAKPQ